MIKNSSSINKKIKLFLLIYFSKNYFEVEVIYNEDFGRISLVSEILDEEFNMEFHLLNKRNFQVNYYDDYYNDVGLEYNES